MLNELVQMEPATSFNPEVSGQIAAIGIVKGKPFNPDARMKKILTDAAAAGRVFNWRVAEYPGWGYYPNSTWGSMLWEGGYTFETPRPLLTKDGIKPFPPTGAVTRRRRQPTARRRPLRISRSSKRVCLRATAGSSA